MAHFTDPLSMSHVKILESMLDFCGIRKPPQQTRGIRKPPQQTQHALQVSRVFKLPSWTLYGTRKSVVTQSTPTQPPYTDKSLTFWKQCRHVLCLSYHGVRSVELGSPPHLQYKPKHDILKTVLACAWFTLQWCLDSLQFCPWRCVCTQAMTG